MRRTIALAAFLIGLAAPAPAFGLRYASPTGNSLNNCDTVATACDLYTAIEGNGPNVPDDGEEVIVLPGSYTATTEIIPTATGLNIHGALDQPRPVINSSALGRISIGSGTISYLHIEGSGVFSEALNLGGGTGDRLFIRGGNTSSSSPVCQCHGTLLSNSVVVSTGSQPALGVTSNGGSATMTYRNVTAYATNPAFPAFRVMQDAASGTLTINAFNVIALNGTSGTDVVADGPNTTITLSHSNYRTTSLADGGVIQDAPGGAHQTGAPMFANAAGGDLSQLVGSPTIDAGITDPLNGTLDFGGDARTVGASTDIGADEFTPPAPPGPGTKAKKCKKRKKKGKKKAASPAAKKKKKKGCKKKKRKKK